MQICAMPRKWADNVVKGKGVKLVGLEIIVALGKELKVLKDMKAAYVLSS